MKHWVRNVIIVVLAVGLLVGGTKWYRSRNASADEVFRTATVTRGDVVATIGATGTLQPEEVINIGAQVAGRITEFGKDGNGKTIDYGSEIEQGMILALIDAAVYQSDVDSAEAQLGQARAGVDRAMADLEQSKARFRQAQRDWQRAQKLGSSDALAQVDYDTYQSTYEAAQANIAIAQASIEQAKRSVAQAQAAVDRARRNLAFCTIASPVKGVIIDRRVNIGQTVVASLNAPSLFLIAKDLRRMELWVAVNEADIGAIKVGQPVGFTVDAFPGRTFRGEVSKIRLNASMTSNVVTYTVQVSTDNSSGILLPYLTANVQFEVNRRDDVLAVPNTALRFTPTEEQVAPDVRETLASAAEPEQRQGRRGGGGDGRRPAATPTTAESHDHRQTPQWRDATVWVRDGQFARPLRVRAGLSDGALTEVDGEELKEGMEVIVTAVRADSPDGASAAGTNPFQPRMPFAGRGRGRM